MGDLIHLSRFRKQKQREAARRQADVNARRHGRTRAERLQERLERSRFDDALDGAMRSPTDGIDDPD